jgi:hypothetical protein
MSAWWIQRPAPSGDRRLPPAALAASGRLIVIGAFLAAPASGARATVWFTAPLLVLALFDRVGRGVWCDDRRRHHVRRRRPRGAFRY